MVKRFSFVLLGVMFLVFVPGKVSAENKIVRKRTLKNAVITSGNRVTVLAGGKTSKTSILDGGIEDVLHGGVSQNASVKKGGCLWLAGGKSFGAAIFDGGLMEVREHEKKSSYASGVRVLSGGRLNVFNLSTAEKITVGSGGWLRVYFPHSLISDVTVLSGGLLHVWKHGTAQNVQVAPGGVLELREESPVLKGTIRIAGQLKASFDHKPDVRKAKIIIDLTRRTGADDYAVENLNYIRNANISINVSRNQEPGSYKFASNASLWKKSLDIMIDDCKAGSIALWKPVKIAGKYYTLKRIEKKCIGLDITLTLPDPDELTPEAEISPGHKNIFKSYGIDIFAENYSVSAYDGRKLTQQELDKDVESMIQDMRMLGRRCVMMSRTSKVFIRGTMKGGANQGWDTLNFAPGAAGAFRHEFNHNFEPFGVAYRFWCSLNDKRFFYRHGGNGLPFRELLNMESNAAEFAGDFEQRYGQETIHEDITTIFSAATHPKSSEKCLEKSRKSPAYRRKLQLLIASYSEVLSEKWWEQFFDFTEEEKAQIRNSFIDVEKVRNLKIFYTKDKPQRYSWQRLTTMGLLDLSPEILRAAGIRKIKFLEHPAPPKVQNDTLIYYERDHEAMAAGIFRECYRRYPKLAKKYLSKRPIDKWAWLFSVCTFKGFRDIARKSSLDAGMRKDVIALQKFTADWLPETFWEEYNWFYNEFKKDQRYLKQFERYGIKLDVPLPDTVQGNACKPHDIQRAKNIFIACTSILNTDFMDKCQIKKVAFAEKMSVNGKRTGAVYTNGVLCLDPKWPIFTKNIFKHLYQNCGRQDDLGEAFSTLLWNSYSAYLKAQKDDAFCEKIKLITDAGILRSHAYENMNLNRIIELIANRFYPVPDR